MSIFLLARLARAIRGVMSPETPTVTRWGLDGIDLAGVPASTLMGRPTPGAEIVEVFGPLPDWFLLRRGDELLAEARRIKAEAARFAEARRSGVTPESCDTRDTCDTYVRSAGQRMSAVSRPACDTVRQAVAR
ncbi:hypothetical protein GCM10009557_11660 [Virgisporangium ochraceum]|uniref:Uncharacterized protein n=1 Tax=Virgisporangium ochraceum TaxID=65505 RepID=A0A8J3ZU10_9ACTN|nr:hypothetical protein [Virgisporangium ochraceum]GIJ69884.1 hypothetical protein Voc01_048010 [Virgisporangium ochraceum]